MPRFTPVPTAFLAPLLMPGAAATPAMAAGGVYRAELAAPTSAQRVIVREQIWRCDATACTSGKSNSRPETLCSGLARRVGAVRSFSVEGRTLSADQLEKCNAAAR